MALARRPTRSHKLSLHGGDSVQSFVVAGHKHALLDEIKTD